MIARYVQKGEAIDYRPESDIAAGDVVVVGCLAGIARLDIAAGMLGSLSVVGVYDIVKGEEPVTAGQPVFWDAEGRQVTAVPTGHAYIGKAVEGASAGAGAVRVLLNAPYTETQQA